MRDGPSASRLRPDARQERKRMPQYIVERQVIVKQRVVVTAPDPEGAIRNAVDGDYVGLAIPGEDDTFYPSTWQVFVAETGAEVTGVPRKPLQELD